MAVTGSSTSLMQRVVGASRLDVATYEDVEADTNATSQALTVVVAAAALAGIGGLLGSVLGTTSVGGNPIGALIAGVVRALLLWAVWSYVVFFVGTRLFKGTATYGELLRTLGFGYAPSALGFLVFVPLVGPLLALVGGIWCLVTGFIGARQALDISNGNTALSLIVAILVAAIPFGIITSFI